MNVRLAWLANRIAQICAIVASTYYFVSGVAFLYFGSAPVMHQDFWRVFERCLRIPAWTMATSRWNNHPSFLPNLLWVADLRWFDGTQAPLVLLGLGLMITTTAMLLWPVWRDSSVDGTARAICTTVIVVGTFWMGRGSITASGGFNCNGYLVVGPVALSLLCVTRLRAESPHFFLASAGTLLAAFAGAFSFGTGMAIWPTLVLIGWAARLPARALAVLLLGGLTAAVLFSAMPAPQGSAGITLSVDSILLAFSSVCRLAGSPFAYALTGWRPRELFHLTTHSPLSLWIGAVGVTAAVSLIVLAVWERSLKPGIMLTGLGLMTFNLIALGLIAIGRTALIRISPAETAGPRYLFWSTLFWTGLLLVIIGRTAGWRRFRVPVLTGALAAAAFTLPSHSNFAAHYQFGHMLMDNAATALINGVVDPKRTGILVREQQLIYQLLPRLRAGRLDMFAEGMHEWLGQSVTAVFGDHRATKTLNGAFRVEAPLQTENGAPAASITGRLSPSNGRLPQRLVIVDRNETIRGIARFSGTETTRNRLLYGGRFSIDSYVGYITSYDPQSQYSARAVVNGSVSEQAIAIQP